MPTDDLRGSKPLEGSESQMKGALSSRLLRSGMRVVMSDLAVRPCYRWAIVPQHVEQFRIVLSIF